METELPIVIDPVQLENQLGMENIRIVDLCKADIYPQAHIPGAVHLDYANIIRSNKPAMGLLPDEPTLENVLSSLGITPDTHVIAYDDEGGGKASRFLWTLDAIGHKRFSLLNGGLHAWANEGHVIDNQPVAVEPTQYRITAVNPSVSTDKDYIIEHLSDDRTVLLDCRSPQEYRGERVFAGKGGHIPGAVNMDWTLSMDQGRNYRLKSRDELEALLQDAGVVKDKETIVYCQTHHRSALTYIMLKSIGYDKVKAYPGSWSEWGNSDETPVEV